MQKYKISISGVGPMLQNKLSRELIKEIKEIAKSKIDEWEEKNYMKKLNTRLIDNEEVVVQPEMAIHQMLIFAAMKLKKTPPKEIGRTWTSYIKSSVIIEEPAIITYSSIEPFGKMVNGNPSSKSKSSKVWKVRPKINDWSTEFVIIDLNDLMNRSIVEDLVTTAGNFVGLSDWRPIFGRFSVKKVVEVD